MVRRGSTVRVRQRALQKRRTSALSRFLVQIHLLLVERAVGMEPFMELSRRDGAIEARIERGLTGYRARVRRSDPLDLKQLSAARVRT